MRRKELGRHITHALSDCNIRTVYTKTMDMKNLHNIVYKLCVSGSSVGIATEYRLDGPGSKLGGDEIFRPSRPALGPTQPPVKWVPGLSRG